MAPKIKPLFLIPFCLTMVVSCSLARSSSSQSNDLTPIPNYPSPTFQPSPTITIESLQITNVPRVVPTETKPAIPKPQFTATSLVSNLIKPHRVTKTGDQKLLTAYWTEDGRYVYFATGPYWAEAPDAWYAYDSHIKTVHQIDSPTKYDRSIWQKLNLPEPTRSPEMRGFISPTGRYLIYNVKYGSFEKYPFSITETWIVNTKTLRRVRVLKDICCGLYQAAWLPDETKVIFQIGYEGPADLYIADVESGRGNSLEIATDMEWALSPDGSVLAIISYNDVDKLQIQLVSIADKSAGIRVIDDAGWPISWSSDSKFLYFWRRNYTYSIGERLYAYHINSGEVRTVLDITNAGEELRDLSMVSFAVSPGESKIAFLSTDLWIVDLKGSQLQK